MNTMMCVLLMVFGTALIFMGISFVRQWRETLFYKTLTRGTFEHFHCWLGGILGIIDIVFGVLAFPVAILTMIYPIY